MKGLTNCKQNICATMDRVIQYLGRVNHFGPTWHVHLSVHQSRLAWEEIRMGCSGVTELSSIPHRHVGGMLIMNR